MAKSLLELASFTGCEYEGCGYKTKDGKGCLLRDTTKDYQLRISPLLCALERSKDLTIIAD